MFPKLKDCRSDIVSTSAESWHPQEEATSSHGSSDCSEIPSELIELKLHASARVALLYGSCRAFEELVRSGELVNVQGLRKVLLEKLPEHERRAIELALLMITVASDWHNSSDDISIEVCSATVPSEMQYHLLREPVLSLLVLCAIWVTEIANGSNAALLAYDTLFSIGKVCSNDHLDRYVDHLLEGKRTLQGDELYWRLRLVNSSLKSRTYDKTIITRLMRTCLDLAERPDDNTIYVNDLLANVLSAIWLKQPFDYSSMDKKFRCRFLTKLLLAGASHEGIVPTLMEAAATSDYTERQLALSALNRAASQGTVIPKGSIPSLLNVDEYTCNLRLGAEMLSGRNSAVIYLEKLYARLMQSLGIGDTDMEQNIAMIECNTGTLVSGGRITEIAKENLRFAYENFFELRDIMQAIEVTYQRLGDSICESLERTDEVTLTSGHCSDNYMAILLYIGMIRAECIPFVVGIIEEQCRQEDVAMETVQFCLETIDRGNPGSIFLHQYLIVACKVLNCTLKQWIQRSVHLKTSKKLELDSLALRITQSLHSLIQKCGMLFLSSKGAMHLCSTLASLAVYVNTVSWGAVTRFISLKVASALIQILELVSAQEEELKTDLNEVNEGVQYKEDIVNYCCASFEILCSAIVPPVRLIRMILDVSWQPRDSQRVFSGLQALAERRELIKATLFEMLRYSLGVRAHTAWDRATVLSLVLLLKKLISLRRRCYRVGRHETVAYVPGTGWKTQKTQNNRGNARTSESNASIIDTLLGERIVHLREDSRQFPCAVLRPFHLLDGNLCVPRSLVDAKIHDCPGE